MDKLKKKFIENVNTKSPAWYRVQTKMVDGKVDYTDTFWRDAKELLIIRKLFGLDSINFKNEYESFLSKYVENEIV